MPVTANFTGPVQTDGINRFRILQSMARSHQGAAQSIPNQTPTALTLDTNDVNTDGMWSNAANTKFTAPINGKYLVIGGIYFGASVGGSGSFLQARKNGAGGLGAGPIASGATFSFGSVSEIVALNAGEYVEIIVFQSSGGPLSPQTGQATYGAMLYIGE